MKTIMECKFLELWHIHFTIHEVIFLKMTQYANSGIDLSAKKARGRFWIVSKSMFSKHDFSTECTMIVSQIYIINLPGPYLAVWEIYLGPPLRTDNMRVRKAAVLMLCKILCRENTPPLYIEHNVCVPYSKEVWMKKLMSTGVLFLSVGYSPVQIEK